MAKTSVLCHCEPVTDVTGVAIRINKAMYGEIVAFYEIAVHFS